MNRNKIDKLKRTWVYYGQIVRRSLTFSCIVGFSMVVAWKAEKSTTTHIFFFDSCALWVLTVSTAPLLRWILLAMAMAVKSLGTSLRVVSLLPSAAEIICLVAPHDILVGRSHEGRSSNNPFLQSSRSFLHLPTSIELIVVSTPTLCRRLSTFNHG